MNYREIEIVSPEDLGATGTHIWDITVSDILSGLVLIWDCTVATVAVMINTIASCIQRIEIIDGSDVLLSLTGEEAQALFFYINGQMPQTETTVVVGDHLQATFPILFGRFLFDSELGLDPNKFKNLQLRVTWDEDAANTGVVVNSLTVRAMAFDEKVVQPKGFLMSKEIKSYTPVINGFEYTDMPLDFPYRLLMLQNKSTTQDPFTGLAQFKLSEGNDKRIPFDMTGFEIFKQFVLPLGTIEQNIRLSETVAAQVVHTGITHRQVGAIAWNAAIIAAADDFAHPTFAGNIMSIALPVNCIPMRCLLSGYAPHFCMGIPFGMLNDINDFYDVTKLNNLRLVTQGGAAVGTTPVTNIVLQQLRNY
jgi:hypothetical protein